MFIPSEGLPRQALALFHILLVALAAWLCGDLAVRLVGLKWIAPTTMTPPALAPARSTARRPPATGYRALMDRNLFGVLVKETQVGAGPTTDTVIPVKSAAELGLKLRGTVTGPPEVAYAVLVRGAEQELYRPGEEVTDGVILERIGRGEVVLRRGAERLQLQIEEGGSGTTRPRISRGSRAPAAGSKSAVASGVREVAPNSYLLERDVVSNSLSSLSTMMKDIRVVPSFDEAKEPNGYRVASIRFGSLLDKLGLKRGDIVQTINGLAISDPDRAYQAYQQFKEETAVEVEVLRGGQPLTLSYEIQ